MKTRIALTLLAAAMLAAGCTPPPAAPVATPRGEDRYLIDPQIGWTETLAPAVERRFEEAWRFFLAGDDVQARRRLAEVRMKAPNYGPAALVEAAMAIRNGELDVASSIVDRALESHPDYTAARVYQAEIALARNEIRRARDIYRELASQPNAPETVRERVTFLDTTLFNEVFTSAQSASDSEAVRLLREALTINPGAHAARILLVQKLVAGKSFDEARRELDPLLNTSELDRPEVQEALAEIDAGRGRYQEAIIRLDRLARRTKDERYARRLEEVKEQFQAANLPPHVRHALESTAATRADFATLLYWNVPAVRFAQNVGAPSIAIDIENVEGREEIIRAIALGVFDVDPVTRRVSPFRQLTAANLARLAARVMTLRGAACSRGLSETQAVLSACNIPNPAAADPDAFVSGREVVRVLQEVDRALK